MKSSALIFLAAFLALAGEMDVEATDLGHFTASGYYHCLFEGRTVTWLPMAATLLARSVQSASVVTPPQAARARLKHFELISVQDHLALMVMVLQEGTIKQQFITFAEPVGPEGAECSGAGWRLGRRRRCFWSRRRIGRGPGFFLSFVPICSFPAAGHKEPKAFLQKGTRQTQI